MYIHLRVCKYACVTGVQRGPARGTEFKFQIWSVSQGVTVCIALPAGSNSFHRWCVFDPSVVPSSPRTLASLSVRGPPFSNPPSTFPIQRIPPLFLSFIYLSRFFILFKRERNLILSIGERSLRLNVLNWSGIHGIRRCTFLHARIFEVNLVLTQICFICCYLQSQLIRHGYIYFTFAKSE